MTARNHALSLSEISSALGALQGWKIKDEALFCCWEIKPYFKAVGFFNQIAWLADQHQYYPKIEVDKFEVSVKLVSTKYGISQNDLRFAQELQQVAQQL